MKPIPFLLLFIMSTNLFGQATQKDTINYDGFKKVQIGVIVSPDICLINLKNEYSTKTGYSDGSEYQYDWRYKSKYGYTTGLNVLFNLNRKIAIETGLQYSNKGYRIIFDNYKTSTYLQYSSNYNAEPLPTKTQIVYSFNYLDIPFKMNFNFGKKRIRFFTGLGFTTDLFANYTRTITEEHADGSFKKIEQKGSTSLKRINFSPTLSFGIDFRINNRNHLRIEPIYRYSVLLFSGAGEHLSSLGLNISYFFGMK